MGIHKSPWIEQLGQHTYPTLQSNVKTDVVVVGGGIAGIATSFFILKNTNKNVVLIDAYKIAHGATGHNAGQITSYFERSFKSIVEEFGLELAARGQKSVEDSWLLLDEMYTDARLDIPLTRFMGHAGLTGKSQLIQILENNRLRVQGGLLPEKIVVADSCPFISELDQYNDLFKIVPTQEIQKLLETNSDTFLAVVSNQKGCINSALFCQEIVEYLLQTYAQRFNVYEHTKVKKVVVKEDEILLDCATHEIVGNYCILCTNGFEDFTIIAHESLQTNATFHHSIEGVEACMAGYIEKEIKPPVAISYFTDPDDTTDDPYYYLTRRSYNNTDTQQNLVAVGGPVVPVNNVEGYNQAREFPEQTFEEIDSFVESVYSKGMERRFRWKGLMGYTKNGIRMIGADLHVSHLLYNLGCNGVGILPSIYGARRISSILNNETIVPSIFDIK